jgi:hypothetical protein
MKRREWLAMAGIVAGAFVATSCEELSLEPTTTSPTASLEIQTTTQSLSATNLIFNETMEGLNPFSSAHDLDVGDWDYAMRFVEYPRFRGVRAARFEIREDQPLVASGKRSEVTIIKDAAEGMAKEMWYSFAVLFPARGYEFDREREVINQWFQNGSPATSLRTQRDRILLESGNTQDGRKQYDVGLITKNKWHQVVMHFVHSYGSDGLIELWLDGVKKLTIRGGNMYDDILPKWKVGLYKSAFKYGTSDVTRRVIFFDNIRVGNSSSTYETMKPTL